MTTTPTRRTRARRKPRRSVNVRTMTCTRRLSARLYTFAVDPVTWSRLEQALRIARQLLVLWEMLTR